MALDTFQKIQLAGRSNLPAAAMSARIASCSCSGREVNWLSGEAEMARRGRKKKRAWHRLTK
jgi:hypothetical protein